ncbi:MAG: HupE/UreJ family protein [Balneolaceae bacterium]|nr:HupE/UreJ family protein [Balneolaceae bacterium]
MKSKIRKSWLFLFSAFLLLPSLLIAHPGAGHISGFWVGFGHPFGGLDHMLAMLAVGIWASQMSDKAVWAVPLTFVGVMLLAGAFGIAGIAIPFVEQGIIMSVLILGILIAVAARIPLAVSAVIVGLFAIFHGHAHGEEIPAAITGLSYGIGFAFSTMILHIAGIGFGMLFKNAERVPVVRYAGMAITVLGVYLLIP